MNQNKLEHYLQYHDSLSRKLGATKSMSKHSEIMRKLKEVEEKIDGALGIGLTKRF